MGMVKCCGPTLGTLRVHRISLPVHNFQKWDRLRILANTFGIGLLLLMESP